MVNGGGHSSQGALLDHAFYGHNGTYGDFEDLCCLPRELGSPAIKINKLNKIKEGKASQDLSLLQLHDMPRHPFSPCILPVLGLAAVLEEAGHSVQVQEETRQAGCSPIALEVAWESKGSSSEQALAQGIGGCSVTGHSRGRYCIGCGGFC